MGNSFNCSRVLSLCLDSQFVRCCSRSRTRSRSPIANMLPLPIPRLVRRTRTRSASPSSSPHHVLRRCDALINTCRQLNQRMEEVLNLNPNRPYRSRSPVKIQLTIHLMRQVQDLPCYSVPDVPQVPSPIIIPDPVNLVAPVRSRRVWVRSNPPVTRSSLGTAQNPITVKDPSIDWCQ